MDPVELYGEEYYRCGCGPIPYEHSEHWIRFFSGIAEQIVHSLKPQRVLDAGCAMGFLVEALLDRGIEARGIDISPYAISRVRRDIAPYCRVASLTEPIKERFDLITCIEVLEHMPAEDGRVAIRNFCQATDTILFSSSPRDLTEPTHFNVCPPIAWLKLFADAGFWPDLQYDAGFLTPHAMLLRRDAQGYPPEVLTLFAKKIWYQLQADDQARTIAGLNRQIATQALSGDADAPGPDPIGDLSARVTELQAQCERLAVAAAHERAQNGGWQEAAAAQLAGRFEPRLGQIEAQLLSLQRNSDWTCELDRLRALSDSLEIRLHQVKGEAERTSRDVHSILHSRIWQILVNGGGMLLNLRKTPQRLLKRIRPSQFLGAGPSGGVLELFCEEPPARSTRLRTGTIVVRGWAVGAERVEIRVDDGAWITPITGILRPDLPAIFPGVPNAINGGFLLELDSTALVNGSHLIVVRATGASGATRIAGLEFVVDHESGSESDYSQWIKDFESGDDAYIQRRMAQMAIKPLISVVVPVYNALPDDLERALASVQSQSYTEWELCIADDRSSSEAVGAILRRFAARDARIKVAFREERGGISAASNSALEMATGEFVALLDHDDAYSPHALFYLVDAINKEPEASLLYSDEDKITPNGRRYDPFFKPGWSPDLLLSCNYLCHLLMFRRDLLAKVGGFLSEYDGSQDYDLILRLSGQARKIVHVPRILYHWRATPQSAAANPSNKQYALDAARRAIAAHLRRRKIEAQVEPGGAEGRWRVRYAIPAGTTVSIVIPSGGKVDLLNTVLNGIAERTDYPDYEVLVADNSTGEAVQRFVKTWEKNGQRARYFDWRNRPFNYSAINNAAARECRSKLLLFLNDDTAPISPGWLRAMVELASAPGVGAVGAKLIYPNGLIQHAGVVLGIFDNCGHAFKGLDGARSHYFGLSDSIRNVSAVTGACLLVQTGLFGEVGGFDELKLAVAFNDVDLCLKIGSKGYQILYSPHALLYHSESASKTNADLVPAMAEVAEMRARWGHLIAADPFYNPNLTRTREDYSYRTKV
jgi:O-antigen biosynthesis protein